MASLWIPAFDLFIRTARAARAARMVRRRDMPRLIPLAVAATLLTVITPLAGGSAAGQDAGSGPRLEVHAWLCPTGIARADFDFAVDCTEPIAGATLTYSPPIGAGFPPEGQDSIESQTTGAGGVATWEALFDDGPFTIEEDGASLAAQDLAIVDYVVRCTVDGDEANLIEDVDDVGLAGVIVPPVDGLGNDQTIVCNWYHLPADEAAAGSTVTIDAFACPEDFDAGDLETTCPEPAAGAALPVSFGPSGGEETYTAGDDGALTFATPAPSTALYLETGVAYIDCRDGAGNEVAEDGPLPWVRAEPPFHSFDVVADGELTCNWYLPPDAGRVSATPGAHGPRLAQGWPGLR